ncbi:hypothetical protein D3C85_1204050 [compost metagenome]
MLLTKVGQAHPNLPISLRLRTVAFERTAGAIRAFVVTQLRFIAAFTGLLAFTLKRQRLPRRASPRVVGFLVGPIVDLADVVFPLLRLLLVVRAVLHDGLDLLLFQIGVVLFAAITCIGNNRSRELTQRSLHFLQVWFQAAAVAWPLMQTVPEDELVFRSDLDVVAGFELAVTHVIFLHPHEGRVRVRFAVAVSLSQYTLMLLVRLQPGQLVFTKYPNRFFQRLVLGFLQQLVFQFKNRLLQFLTRDRARFAKFRQIECSLLGIFVFLSLFNGGKERTDLLL